MKKQLITLAVAAAMATPVVAMAEATLYGKINQSIDYVDVQENAYWAGSGVPRSSAGNPSLNGAGFAAGYDAYLNSLDAYWNTYDAAFAGGNDSAQLLAGILGNVLANVAHPGIPSFDLEGVGEFLGADGIDYVNQVWELHTGSSLDEDVLAALYSGAASYADGVAGAVPTAPIGGSPLTRGTAYKGWDLNSNSRANRIGVKGSEDLGNGLKAIYQIELQVRLADANNNIADNDRGSISMRNTFVGLAGNWGTFLVGRHDTPFKISTGKLDLFADTLADYNFTVGFMDVRADNAVAYISPSFSGLQFAGAVVPSGGSTPTGVWNSDADGIADAWSVALIYSNGPFYASAAYELLGDKHWAALDPLYVGNFGKNADDDAKYRFGLGLLDWNGFTLTGIYEGRDHVLGNPEDASYDLWQVQAAYSFGNNTIKGMYGQSSLDGCADPFNNGFAFTCSAGAVGRTLNDLETVGYGIGAIDQQDKSTWAVGFDHNFSKRTKAYMLYTSVEDDADDADWSGFSLGMMHSF